MTTNPVWQRAVDAARASAAHGELVNEQARHAAMTTVLAKLRSMFGDIDAEDVWTDTVGSGKAVVGGYLIKWLAYGNYVSFSIDLPCIECGAVIDGPHDFQTLDELGRIFLYWQAAKDLKCPECGATEEEE